MGNLIWRFAILGKGGQIELPPQVTLLVQVLQSSCSRTVGLHGSAKSLENMVAKVTLELSKQFEMEE